MDPRLREDDVVGERGVLAMGSAFAPNTSFPPHPVIPAPPRHSREGGNPGGLWELRSKPFQTTVVAVQAGIHFNVVQHAPTHSPKLTRQWIPAFARMTLSGSAEYWQWAPRSLPTRHSRPTPSFPPHPVIPAKAGIQAVSGNCTASPNKPPSFPRKQEPILTWCSTHRPIRPS